MAGKAYTMREMKSIVEYLTERKAFSEIKGRKMWTEFANSGKTTRTWQSLKETFIKRILPDLHNPYYRLTLDQVRSFREGKDVAEKEKHNRLQYVTASEDSVTSEVKSNKNPTPNEAASTSKGDGIVDLDEEVQRVTGEDTAAKINSRNRSSADTVVIETYDNAEQLQEVLESPLRNVDKFKPMKDLLIFEPMTPLVKELLEDFETESENDNEVDQSALKDDPKTVEGDQVKNERPESDDGNSTERHTAEEIIEIHNTEDENGVDVPNTDENNLQKKSHNVKPQDEENNNGNEAEKQADIITIHDSEDFVTAEVNSETVDTITSDTIIPPNRTKRTSDQIQISGNSSSDTIIPNNQECLNITQKSQNITQTAEEKKNGKRTSSHERDGKKKKLASEKSVIEIEDSQYIHEDVPVIEINSEIPDIGATVEVNTDPKNASDNSIDEASKNNPTNVDKPRKSEDNNVTNVDVHINPCLQSVSLFEEQFKTTQYSSDSDDKTAPKEKQVLEKPQQEIVEEPQKRVMGKPEKKILEKPQKKVIEEPQKKVIEEPQKKVIEEPQKKVIEEPQKKVIEEPQKKVVEKPQKKVIEKSQKQVIEKPQKDVPMKLDTQQKENKEKTSPKKAPELPKQANVEETSKRKELLSRRDKILANVFGFTNGPSTSRQSQSRKSRQTHKRFQPNQYRTKSESNSSEWMSESDSDEYISPPRPSKQKRKYLKPKPSRILQDPEEGLLYVMFGKHIYPVVKNGKHVKNFVTYKSDSESDSEEETYWKKKYIEEKRKLEEFKMLLDENDFAPNDRASPILQCAAKKSTSTVRKAEHITINDKEKPNPQIENKSKDEKLVLKFATGHGEELCLEGGWTQISSAIPQMMQMLRNNPTSDSSKEKPALKIQAQNPRQSNVSEMEISSGKSTPTIITTLVDPEVHEKVNQLETEIFKEIEEREREEQTKENETLLTVNVAKRRGRPRKTPSPSSSSETPLKKQKTKDDTDSKKEPTNAKETKNSKKKSSLTATTSKNTNSKVDDVTSNQSKGTSEPSTSTSQQKTAKSKLRTDTKQSTETSKRSVETSKQNVETSKQNVETSKQNVETSKQSVETSKQNVETSTQTETKESKVEIEQSKPRTSLRLSRQRYSVSRDKDVSIERLPVRQLRTPKKYDTDSSTSDVGIRTRRSATKEKEKMLTQKKDIDFEDDNVRFMFPPSPPKNKNTPKGKKKKSPERNVVENLNSLDSTQGYQDSDISPLKLNVKRKRKVSVTAHKKQHRRLKRRHSYPTFIQDLIPVDSSNSSYFVPVRKLPSTTNSKIYRSDSYQLLMPQPKLVHKMEPVDENSPRHFGSISKDSSRKSSELNILVEIGSSSNVSLPLSPELSIVENIYKIRDIINNNARSEPLSYEGSDKIDHNDYIIPDVDVSMPLMKQQCKPKRNPKKTDKNALTDTFMKKVSTVNLKEDQTLSETLDQRLRNLLLESGKKKQNDKANDMEVDPPNEPLKNDKRKEPVKKGNTKKRCSTPRKKNSIQKAKERKDAIIEEEHVETCSFGGRKSCPPVITLICDENANDCTDIIQGKNAKKKDIIKVKIQRPKEKKLKKNKTLEKSAGNITSYADSEINDAEISDMLYVEDDSVDLIHNHSETCLLANECICDSLEIVENSKSSVISVNSSTLDSDLRRLLEDNSHISEELFGTAEENANTVPISQTPTTVYHSPTWTSNSLLTDDLSDEVNRPASANKPSWYLLTEDEMNTQTNTNQIGFDTNLNQLFPVACAVPNLSTISEMSKENEDSRKSRSNVVGDAEMYDLLSMF